MVIRRQESTYGKRFGREVLKMAYYRYKVIHTQSGTVHDGIVEEEPPETDDEIKREIFAEELLRQGFLLCEFEKLWIN